MVGVNKFNKNYIVHLSTISVLMAAKLEQPISPSFNRMIGLLTPDEQKVITKSSLIDLEAQILVKLGFDFNFPGPMQSLERFLRLTNYDRIPTIYDMAYQICKFQLNEASFLNYRPSQIAASAAIIAINIYLEEKQENASKLAPGQKLKMNLDIWNNEEVTKVSGYSITDIKDCIYDLSNFISRCLSPNKLEDFDIAGVLKAQPFDQLPSTINLSLRAV